MRELQIGAASTKLRVFNDICKAMGKDTLSETMRDYRLTGFDGWKFVRFLCVQTGTAVPSTAFGYLKYMCEGSPLLRTLIYYVCHKDAFLKIPDENGKPKRKDGKLLVMEDTPLIALFLSWGMNMMGVNTAMFHSGLSTGERNELQDDFNDPDSELDLLLNMYEVGGVGRNFHVDCHNGIMTGAGKNQSAETQMIGRIVRVCVKNWFFLVLSSLTNLQAPQKEAILITKISIKNTIGAYKESRKRDKALIELATRANDPEIRALLVYCLNDFNEAIRLAQEDPENAELMSRLNTLASIEKTNKMLMASAVPDKNELVSFETIDGKRQRKERGVAYGDEVWDGLGRAKSKSKKGQEKMTLEELDKHLLDENDVVDEDEDEDEDEDDEDIYEPDEDDEPDDDAIFTDDGDESDLEGLSADALLDRKARKEAKLAMRSEIQEDEGVRRLKMLLTLDHTKVYSEEDLGKEETLKRSLELAYCARFGQNYDKPPSIHIQVCC